MERSSTWRTFKLIFLFRQGAIPSPHRWPTVYISRRYIRLLPSSPRLLRHFIFLKGTFKMETTSFTFLNTTGAPRLSKPAAKRVRGHVTRTNFANRRRRKAEAADKTSTALVGVTQDVAYPSCNGSNHDAWDALADALSVATSTSGQDQSARLRALHYLRPP
jgi:hypothetical protein